MRISSTLLLACTLLAAAGCKTQAEHERPDGSPQEATASAGTEATDTTTGTDAASGDAADPEAASDEAASGDATAQAPATPPAGSAAEALRPPAGRVTVQAGPGVAGGALLPPRTPGAAEVRITGCAADADAARRRAAAGPAAKTRSPSPAQTGPEVRVRTLGTGVVVVHEARHACCLQAEVTAEVKGDHVRLVERFSGRPCRCMCSSELKTAVGLAPGKYKVTVERPREGEASAKPIHEAYVEVGAS